MKLVSLLAVMMLTMTACGVPSFNATEQQREADLEWVFAVFDRNYGPLEWKKTHLGVDFQQVKDECVQANKTITSNDEFRALVYSCISKFQDAHTGGQQVGDILPGKANVATLGFVTHRHIIEKKEKKKDPNTGAEVEFVTRTEALRVVKFLPTTKANNSLIKVGDLILAANGMPIDEYQLENVSKYRNLGQKSSNLTAAAEAFAVRNSLTAPMPKEDDITLKVLRGTDVFELTLPWRKQDMFEFAKEQNAAALANKKTESPTTTEAVSDASPGLKPRAPNFLTDLVKRFLKMNDNGDWILSQVKWLLTSTFRVVQPEESDVAIRFVRGLSSAEEKKEEKKDRTLPIPNQKISNPSFEAHEIIFKGKRYMYARIPSFSIGDVEVTNFGALMAHYKNFKYDGLVLDLLDNGGGSLVHGMAVADRLTSKKVAMSKIQVMLNDSWVDSYKSMELFAESDADKSLGERISRLLEDDRSSGKRLSRPLAAESLSPVISLAKTESCAASTDAASSCLPAGTPIVIMVNELCASMCDIFASIVKDNSLAKIVGSQTMGAGGNVVMHAGSPVSGIMLSQTESLIVDKNGQYLENLGVVPDVELNTVSDRALGYKDTILKALAQFN